MSWNYRVIRHPSFNVAYLAIHEVYYNDQGKPDAVTDEPAQVDCDVSGDEDGIAELRATLTRMLESLDKPILDYGDF